MPKTKKFLKRKNRKNGTRKNRKIRTRKMRGGNFSTSDIFELNNLGFLNRDIQILEENGLNSIILIRLSLQQINPQTGSPFTPQQIIESINNEQNENNYDFDYDFTADRTTETVDTEPIGGRSFGNRKYKK
jgi:hypothetical protein